MNQLINLSHMVGVVTSIVFYFPNKLTFIFGAKICRFSKRFRLSGLIEAFNGSWGDSHVFFLTTSDFFFRPAFFF